MSKWMATLARGSGAERRCAAPRRVTYAALPSDAALQEAQGRTARPPKADGLLELWSDAEPELEDAHLYGVREVIQWDEGSPHDVVAFFFVRRRTDLTREAFERRYREGHTPVARTHHPGLVRYVQNFVEAESTAAPHWDAIAQLHFASEDDLRERFYRDVESPAAVAADVADFVDPSAGFTLLTRRVAGLEEAP